MSTVDVNSQGVEIKSTGETYLRDILGTNFESAVTAKNVEESSSGSTTGFSELRKMIQAKILQRQVQGYSPDLPCSVNEIRNQVRLQINQFYSFMSCTASQGNRSSTNKTNGNPPLDKFWDFMRCLYPNTVSGAVGQPA
ncbi:unnamed protein product [Allacma fusca]|uniref:Uncharacterized protein n=1 Tax=Allacma fusca TaxID=39272 RepID=A0A8J2NMS7_9HEXA|nr:unnamed protein product [Allacma fusca]